MTENEAKDCIKGKLDCMNKCDVFDCKNTDECENCNYCYSQGNFGEQKKAFEMAIQALEKVQQYEAIGTIEEFKALKEMIVTQMDIDTFKSYIDDCMDDVAFGNTDWNHSLALALKCMELHKLDWQ